MVSLMPKEKYAVDADQESRNLLVFRAKNIGDAGKEFMTYCYFDFRDTTNGDMGTVDDCMSQSNVRSSEVVVHKDWLQRVGQVQRRAW